MDIVVAKDHREFELLRELVSEYESNLPADLRHTDFESERERLHEAYGSPNQAFVATLDGQACGCVVLAQGYGEPFGIVKKLYVRPSFRGHGVARALMDALIGAARARGYTRIVLDTDAKRLNAAYRLYLLLGFMECAPYGSVEYRCPTFMELLL